MPKTSNHSRTRGSILNRTTPIDYRQHRDVFERLQGNIVKGHGREHTVNIFLSLEGPADTIRETLRWLAREYVTSAYDQLVERDQFAMFRVPGSLFGNLFLTANAYTKLGFGARLREWFRDPREPGEPGQQSSPFSRGMYALRDELGDALPAEEQREPLERAHAARNIDALLLLADDSGPYLLRVARALMTQLEERGGARVLAVEIGDALRNEDEEGIEHFGYVDGRSQPLFLVSDFRMKREGRRHRRFERVDDKAIPRERGAIDFWDPFAPLSLVLINDPAVSDGLSFGSYYVFRKLEQDVLRFSIAEQQLADALQLEGEDRKRAGAMIVGRFRDGTPLALSPTDGFIPAKANNFRYDDLDASFHPVPNAPADPYGLKCPFQAHIRKVNPRQNVRVPGGPEEKLERLAEGDRARRIVRRGITYGSRKRAPNTFQALEDLPTHGVGLLFACFQASIQEQFLFMQRHWANNINFMTRGETPDQTWLDGVIGQRLDEVLPQHWRSEYGGEFAYEGTIPALPLEKTHTTNFTINGFVRFKGGEFFFAPSLTFLRAE